MAELAPPEVIAALRRPKQIYTEAYLNDPIKFDTDIRFIPETVIGQLNEIEVLPRDTADFVVVELNNAEQQYYAVTMFSALYNKDDFKKIIDRRIRQLPTIDLPNI